MEKIIECRMCGNDDTVMYINPETKLCNRCQDIEYHYEREELKNRNVEQFEL